MLDISLFAYNIISSNSFTKEGRFLWKIVVTLVADMPDLFTQIFTLNSPALRAGYDIHYIGSYTGIEKGLVEAQNIPYTGIESGKLRRYFDPKNFLIHSVLLRLHTSPRAYA